MCVYMCVCMCMCVCLILGRNWYAEEPRGRICGCVFDGGIGASRCFFCWCFVDVEWGIMEWTMDRWVGGFVLWDELGTMDEV